MFNAIRQRIRRFSGRREPVSQARDATVQLRLPSPYGGKPWLTATVALTTTPHAHGDTLRLRAHVDGCIRLPTDRHARPALANDARGTRHSLMRYGRDRAASLVRGVIERLPAEQLAPLTSQRWRTWLDIQLSKAPFDAGADALMPEQLRGVYGGSLPRAGSGEPRLGVWSGPSGGALGGVAQLALLQLDERDLGRRRGDHEVGFNLNASAARVVEPAGFDEPRHDDA